MLNNDSCVLFVGAGVCLWGWVCVCGGGCVFVGVGVCLWGRVCVCGGGCVFVGAGVCLWGWVFVCGGVFVRVGVCCGGGCVSIGLGYDSGVSRAILDNMITNAHSIHRPCSYFQCLM